MQRNKHNVITQRDRCKGASANFTCELWWGWGTNEAQVQNLDTIMMLRHGWSTNAKLKGDGEVWENNHYQ